VTDGATGSIYIGPLVSAESDPAENALTTTAPTKALLTNDFDKISPYRWVDTDVEKIGEED
jgi:hypothetical protein